jgi:NAD(P)H-nitrite reductase large subunit
MNDRRIVIIGNGISGITCARNLRKNNPKVEITVISGETKYFFSRTALMYIYMGHMKFEHTKPYEDWFWEKNKIQLLHAWIKEVDFEKKKLFCQNGNSIPYDDLVLATGSKPLMLDWPGISLHGVQGLYSFQDLNSMEVRTNGIQRAVVVGGGLIGIEMAEMLLSRGIAVTLLVREENYWDNVLPKEEAILINRHILEHGVDLRLSTELGEVIGNSSGEVKAIKTKDGQLIDCQFVGVAIGVTPNIDFLKDTRLKIGKGILVDRYFRTSEPNVYAIGDCAEFSDPLGGLRKPIEQVWYTGRMHGELLASNLLAEKLQPYDPGIWFNSAKFFDIEYQTYGEVPSVLSENSGTFFWEEQGGKIAVRFNFDKHTEVIQGVNALGWRLRHDFFDKAISQQWKMDRVMEHLDRASFNSEFFKSVQTDALKAYNFQFHRNIRFKKRSFFQKITGSSA